MKSLLKKGKNKLKSGNTATSNKDEEAAADAATEASPSAAVANNQLNVEANETLLNTRTLLNGTTNDTTHSKQHKAAANGNSSNNNGSDVVKQVTVDMINKQLPRELIIRIFSFLDIVSLCRCAQVSKYWNQLALDGSNWQYVDLFTFQRDVTLLVVENLARRCGEFLKGLRLENCRSLTDEAIVKLCSFCKNVEILNMKQCIKLSNQAFIYMGSNMTSLVHVNFESCMISDDGLLAIAKGCPYLQSIDISWCKMLSSAGLVQFASLSAGVKHLSCRFLSNVNDQVIKKLSEHCVDLVYLNLTGCKNVWDQGLVAIASSCPALRHLSISNCTHLSDLSLQSLGKHCAELNILECAGCSNFSDNGFLALTKGCHQLIRVDLEECNRITDVTLQNLSSNCPNLRHLTLSRCECITDEGIRQLSISNCACVNETLQVLELDNCPLITDVTLEQLYGCPSLVQLELYDCQLITRNGIKKFQSKLPNVRVHAYFAPSNHAANQRPSRSCYCKCCTIL